MARDEFRKRFNELLAGSGITVNGDRPWDMQVHRDALFSRVLAHGSLGLGEAYIDGWWDCRALDQFFHRLLAAGIDQRVRTLGMVAASLKARLFNPQRASRAFVVGEHHYDIGNDLYRFMLDRRMNYSCGYWKEADNLDSAQERKLDLTCRKLQLAKGQRLLDIGCGWGGMSRFAAENYGVTVVGVTVSREQADLAREQCRGLPVEIRLQDYRSLDERFDRVVSIGMFEHVGAKNYATFMTVVGRCLKDNGLFLLHTIGGNRSVTTLDPWIERYIFPNGLIPSAAQIARSLEGRFMIEDWHNFGPDYDRTLMAWWRNFEAAWPNLAEKYGERFGRMWRYYLLSCAGAFRARDLQVWQLVLSRNGVPDGYRAPR